MPSSKNSQVTFINVNLISTNPFQPRERVLDDEEFRGLVQSVIEHGVLEPLVVADTPVGMQLIAGERRWRAAKKAGLEEVPVHLVKTSPKGMLEMALVENVQRSNLSPLERAQGISRLIKEFGFSQADIAQRMGKSATYITNTLRLLDLPDPIKDGLNRGVISEAHAKALMAITDPVTMVKCYRQIVKMQASAARTEQIARLYAQQPVRKLNAGAKLAQEERIVQNWLEKLKEEVDSPTSLKLNRSNNQTKITITLKGSQVKTEADLARIMKMMGLEEAEALLKPQAEPEPEMMPIAELGAD